MKLVPHPLLERDIIGMAEHVFQVTGDPEAAHRRLAETRALIGDIMREPALGSRLGAQAEGWRIRHSARDRRISVVFRHDPEADASTWCWSLSAARTGQRVLPPGRSISGPRDPLVRSPGGADFLAIRLIPEHVIA